MQTVGLDGALNVGSYFGFLDEKLDDLGKNLTREYHTRHTSQHIADLDTRRLSVGNLVGFRCSAIPVQDHPDISGDLAVQIEDGRLP